MDWRGPISITLERTYEDAEGWERFAETRAGELARREAAEQERRDLETGKTFGTHFYHLSCYHGEREAAWWRERLGR